MLECRQSGLIKAGLHGTHIRIPCRPRPHCDIDFRTIESCAARADEFRQPRQDYPGTSRFTDLGNCILEHLDRLAREMGEKRFLVSFGAIEVMVERSFRQVEPSGDPIDSNPCCAFILRGPSSLRSATGLVPCSSGERTTGYGAVRARRGACEFHAMKLKTPTAMQISSMTVALRKRLRPKSRAAMCIAMAGHEVEDERSTGRHPPG
ncbi:hypothetical protein [Nonomuraea sp. NPDC049158]|uniref:hypothetical protein n=1 Tax=Nonomuraea sp. NPDC049158 TaxID=3155649 RepID=UPI003405D480